MNGGFREARQDADGGGGGGLRKLEIVLEWWWYGSTQGCCSTVLARQALGWEGTHRDKRLGRGWGGNQGRTRGWRGEQNKSCSN